MPDVCKKERTAVHPIVDSRHHIGITLTTSIGNLLVGIQINFVEIDVGICLFNEISEMVRIDHEIVVFLIIRHKGHHIAPVSKVGDLRRILRHQVSFLGITNTLVHRRHRLRSRRTRESSDRQIEKPFCPVSLVLVQKSQNIIIGILMGDFRHIVILWLCTIWIIILDIVFVIGNINSCALGSSAKIVTRATKQQQISRIGFTSLVVNHPHIVTDSDRILRTARKLVVDLLRGDNFHVQTIILSTKLSQSIGLGKKIGMRHNHHIHCTSGVQILVGHLRQRGHRQKLGTIKEYKLSKIRSLRLEMRSLIVSSKRVTNHLRRIGDIPHRSRSRNAGKIKTGNISLSYRGWVPESRLTVAQGNGTRRFHFNPIQIANRRSSWLAIGYFHIKIFGRGIERQNARGNTDDSTARR